MLGLRKYGHWYLLGGLAVVAVALWSAVFRIEVHSGRVFLHVFDVGQGDALLLEAPNGNQVLIDGGPDAAVLSKLGGTLPFWDRALDLLILTHPHADHLDGLLEVLQRYDVGMVLESGVNHSLPEYGEWEKLLREKDVRVVIARAGERIHLADALHLDVLAPFTSREGQSVKDVHAAMVVLKFVHGKAAALLMGDAERALERELLASGVDLDVDVLKVGHHGSKTSTADEFLQASSPQAAVISAGRKNRYGHPAPEVLDRLAAIGARVLRTDRDGTVTFVSGGERLILLRKE